MYQWFRFSEMVQESYSGVGTALGPPPIVPEDLAKIIFDTPGALMHIGALAESSGKILAFGTAVSILLRRGREAGSVFVFGDL